jgi:hypothetical protein
VWAKWRVTGRYDRWYNDLKRLNDVFILCHSEQLNICYIFVAHSLDNTKVDSCAALYTLSKRVLLRKLTHLLQIQIHRHKTNHTTDIHNAYVMKLERTIWISQTFYTGLESLYAIVSWSHPPPWKRTVAPRRYWWNDDRGLTMLWSPIQGVLQLAWIRISKTSTVQGTKALEYGLASLNLAVKVAPLVLHGCGGPCTNTTTAPGRFSGWKEHYTVIVQHTRVNNSER